MFEPATAHVRVELIAHEPGQAHPSLAQRFEERWGVLLNDVVQHRVLFRTLDCKSPALVADGGSPVNTVGR